jgi:hypothetical protein
MLPLIPKSVKMESEVSSRLKTKAQMLGYSENQLIVESLKATLDAADDETNAIPRIVVLLRSAQKHQIAPLHFGNFSPQEHRVKQWWGA